MLCQFTDERGRPTLKDYINIPGIYPAGRLDLDSEGLLILSDDGNLIHNLTDPRFKRPKTYLAQVEGTPIKEQADKIAQGIMIEGQKTLPAKVRIIDEPVLWERSKPIRYRKTVPTSWLEISIIEGRNRQIRKMTAAVGLPCLRVVRIAVGKYKLNELKPGEFKREA